MSALTPQEQTDLARLEVIVARAEQATFEAGRALAEIQDRRLYRGTHKTFEAYLDQVWSLPRSTAYDRIAAARVAENVRTSDKVSIQNESQARQLVGLPPEQQRLAWKQAVETAPAGKITAAHVARAVEEVTGSPPGALPGETHPDVVAGLAALSPEVRRELLTRAEEETVSNRPAADLSGGGDQAEARLKNCRRHLAKALAEAKALGGEADVVIDAIEAAVEAAEAFAL